MTALFTVLFILSLVMLPVTLIKPSWATRGMSNNRKKTFILYLGAVLFFAVLAGATTSASKPVTQVVEETRTSTQPPVTTQENSLPQLPVNPTFIPTPEPVETPNPTLTPNLIS